jgi:hypothetical protein
MGQKAGTITIDLTLGTAQFVLDMEKANGKFRELGQHGVSSMQATSAALRTVEGNFTNNIRAVERFLATTLNLGPIIQKAFPLVGGIAFGGMLVELGSKAYNFFKTMQEAPEKAGGAFRELNNSLRTSADELRVANDRLENDIAKLEGKRQNNLALALDAARLAADKLGDSLDADLDKINKVLKEHEVSHIVALLTGQARTDDLREQLFGKVGYGGWRGTVDAAVDQGRANISGSKTPAQALAALNAMSSSINSLYDKPLADLQTRIQEGENKSGLRQAPSYQAYVHAPPGTYAPWGAQAGQSDQGANLETSRELLRMFTAERDKTLQEARAAALGLKKPGAEQDHALQEFSDRVTARNITTPLAREFFETSQEVKKTQIPGADAVGTRGVQEAVQRYQRQWAADYIKTWGDDAHNEAKVWQEALQQQIKDDERLQASAKKLHELDRKEDAANIESGRSDAAHRVRLATLSSDGDGAALAAKVRDIKLEQVEAERKILSAHAEDYDMLAENTKLEQQATAARQEYEEGIAKAQDSALKIGGAPQLMLRQIQSQLAALNSIQVTSGNIRDIELSRKALHDQMLQAISGELQKSNQAMDGVRAFFVEMQEQGKTTAAIIYNALNSALDATSQNLAKMATGQKSAWGREFQGIGQQMVQAQIKSSLQGVLGRLGVHMGVPTGKAGDPIHAVVDNMPGGIAGPGASSTPLTLPKGTVFSGSQGDSMIFNLLANFGSNLARSSSSAIPFGGARALGGDVDPGSAFLVGENGPEIFRPPSAGSIVPNNRIGGSGDVYYSIDARGSDLGASNRVARAIEAAHSSAVANGVQASIERQKRRPQKSHSSPRN